MTEIVVWAGTRLFGNVFVVMGAVKLALDYSVSRTENCAAARGPLFASRFALRQLDSSARRFG